MIRVKVFITIDIDPDEYPIPADEMSALKLRTAYVNTSMMWTVPHRNIRNTNGVTPMNNYLPTDYQNFIALSRYARWKEDEQSVRLGMKQLKDTLIIWKAS